MLEYDIVDSGQILSFSSEVLAHFDINRQRHLWNREAGGHLFAKIAENQIHVVYASGPEKADYRSRFAFGFKRSRAQSIIDEQFAQGKHYVGDWHSHPQNVPSPSTVDQRTMASRVLRSDHGLRGMIFCIIGRLAFPNGLAVLLHNGSECLTIRPCSGD